MATENPNNTPAQNTPAQNNKDAERIAVEALQTQLETDTATFAGVRVRENWAVGALVTRAQYQRAIKTFLEGPTAKDGE